MRRDGDNDDKFDETGGAGLVSGAGGKTRTTNWGTVLGGRTGGGSRYTPILCGSF